MESNLRPPSLRWSTRWIHDNVLEIRRLPRLAEYLRIFYDQSYERQPVLKFKSVSIWKLLHQHTSRSLPTSCILQFACLVLGLDTSTVTTIRSARCGRGMGNVEWIAADLDNFGIIEVGRIFFDDGLNRGRIDILIHLT